MVLAISSLHAQPYSIVLLRKNPVADSIGEAAVRKIMDGHMNNINKLASEKKLHAAGPFENGGGIFIMNSNSKSEIESWLEPDPGIQAKRWQVEILPYKPVYRGVCPVKEPYEMTFYSYIRFNAIVSKSTAQEFPQIMQQHQEYIRQLIQSGNVVTYAEFSARDGGILIMNGDVHLSVLDSDPAVQEGLITTEFKKLYIAKGSFCE